MNQYQPIKFHPSVHAIFTLSEDGSIATGAGKPDSDEHRDRRIAIITRYFASPNHTKVVIRYGDDKTYTHIERLINATQASVEADAVYTTSPGVVMALPVADCVATLVYDPVTNMLGILHLGRHSSVAGLIENFVIEVSDVLGSDPHDWHVWMSPSLKQVHDRMDYFTPDRIDEWENFMKQDDEGRICIDVDGHNVQRFIRAGVPSENIYNAPEDTYDDKRFFSQRAADEQGDRTRQGRMMLAASLLDKNQVS